MPMKHEHLLIAGVTFIGVGVAGLSFFAPEHKQFVVGAWTILTPAWFWFEYTFLTSDNDKNDATKFARLKYSQELAAKVWLAVTAVLVAFYFDWPPK